MFASSAPMDPITKSFVASIHRFCRDNDEANLRVSASMARLLAPAGEQRSQLRRRIGDLYQMRSDIVHGSKPPDPGVWSK